MSVRNRHLWDHLGHARLLPGIEFQTLTPKWEEALPRMDIAAFVGFAASGPINTPVPIEDMGEFRNIFGPDVPLVRDSNTNQILYSQLGPAVEAFLENGGKRCWVVGLSIEPNTSPDIKKRKEFSSGLFLDPDLAEVGTAALLSEAHHKCYINNQPLLGIHSLLPIEEVTLVSVPDAVQPMQPGWGDQSRSYMQDELLKIHRGLLRFCAARGDMFAVLDLPRRYTVDDAIDYKRKLIEIWKSDDRVLSFGAIYHPWTCMSIESGFEIGSRELRYIPPGGSVCGMMASRAIARGAWIAPANEPLKGIIALEPFIPTKRWQELFNEQINVIRQSPQGFILLSADTLSGDIALHLQSINVRRLLNLLHRLATREGVTYTFQPNNRDLHQRIQYRFEQFLSQLYTQGAFAGDSPEKSYQVVSDSSVNTPADSNQGRFIIELRVAPSLPLAFITVRLIQTQNGGLSIMEI